ncbi:MAG: OsmC family protein [Firmicutes bacterium]|nr:OsmC family protein [Bacillota bacterium]
MNNGLEVNIRLTDQKVHFTGVSETNPERPVEFDFQPPLGEGQGYKGLELLLMSFAGCVSTTIVYLLRSKAKDVSGFKMNAKGITSLQPLALQRICFEAVLESRDADDSDIENAIGLAGEAAPVWKAIKNNVEVSPGYRVIRV